MHGTLGVKFYLLDGNTMPVYVVYISLTYKQYFSASWKLKVFKKNYFVLYYVNLIFFPDKSINPWSANPTKWWNTRKLRWLLLTNCLNVFDHFVGLALKALKLMLNLVKSL